MTRLDGTCTASGCTNTVDLAINSTTRPNGLVTTIYQHPDDAPKKASDYCVSCGMHLAAELARLSNPSAVEGVRPITTYGGTS